MRSADVDPQTRAAAPKPWRRRLEACAISLVGGVLWYLSARWTAAGPLLALAMVLLVTPAAVERWRAPLWGYLPGQLLYAVVGHLPAYRYGLVGLIVFPLAITWSYATQAVATGILRRTTRLPAWVTVPLGLGAGEWLRPWLNPGNFNMYQIGSFLFDWPIWIQSAELIGAPALSVLAALPFAVGVEAVRAATGTSTWRSVRRGAGLALTILVLLGCYGAVRIGQVSGEPGPRLAVIQPSLDHGRDLTAGVVIAQQQLTAQWVEPGEVDMVVWPENAILSAYDVQAEYHGAVEWTAASRQAPLLFGAQGMDPVEHRRPTNTAYLVAPDGALLGRYDKVVLFPFTERRVFPALERVWPWMSKQIIRLTLATWRDAPNGWAAPAPIPMSAEVGGRTWTFWTPICYETCYTDPARAARRRGARFFVNLTSEGWLGWGPTHNMLAVSVLRAVENRVGVVRGANAGISAFILPSGRIDTYLRGHKTGRLLLEPGVAIRRVTAGPPEPTVYARIGFWIDQLWMILAVVAVALSLWRRRRERRRKRPMRLDPEGM
ncbi:MAG: apolipoprotein N-acyltransferase [Acidobacteriota bacterium]|nr:apolipoprotein N-acyltransferase [Acidobacteriota bacterium]MDQ7088512.1 apolipoprotein N-acyltransferase [Acidobacteriota bacterium]